MEADTLTQPHPEVTLHDSQRGDPSLVVPSSALTGAYDVVTRRSYLELSGSLQVDVRHFY